VPERSLTITGEAREVWKRHSHAGRRETTRVVEVVVGFVQNVSEFDLMMDFLVRCLPVRESGPSLELTWSLHRLFVAIVGERYGTWGRWKLSRNSEQGFKVADPDISMRQF